MRLSMSMARKIQACAAKNANVYNESKLAKQADDNWLVTSN